VGRGPRQKPENERKRRREAGPQRRDSIFFLTKTALPEAFSSRIVEKKRG